MKAKIKATGEIIKLAEYATIDLDVCDSYGNPIQVKPEEIEFIQDNTANIDWEQRTWELYKAIIQGCLAGNHSWCRTDIQREVKSYIEYYRKTMDE